MPSQQTLASFKEGLRELHKAEDFTSLQHIIDKLVSICPADELPLAKDAIARVIRAKQAEEATKYRAYPQALEEVDKKYRDLYIVLRTAESKIPPTQTQQIPNQMIKAPFGGLSLPNMLQWLNNKKKYLITGGALATVGGASYLLYKHLNDNDKSKKELETKESSLDRTIRSIQKYKAFTQMVNDPDFSGDYAELISGKKPTKTRRNVKKQEEPKKSKEWERDEKSLMNDMDTAFNSLSARPNLDYGLPKLPAPKNIDPRDVVDDAEVLSLKPMEKRKTKKTRKTRKTKAPTLKSREDSEKSSTPEPLPEEKLEKPKKRAARKPRKPRKEKSENQNVGRLIPIVKRTKRVKKVGS